MTCSPHSSVTLDTPVGQIQIETCGDGIHSVRVECTVKDPDASVRGKVSVSDGNADEPSLVKCVEWFKSYFEGTVGDINFPLCSKGISPFQQDAYKAVSKIKPGDSMSYAQLGSKLGKSGCARAVGSAMGKNRHLILVPCHRLVHSSGKLTKCTTNGYLKPALLAHEASISKSSLKRDSQEKAVLAPKSQPKSEPEAETTDTKPEVKAEIKSENGHEVKSEIESDEETPAKGTKRKAAAKKKPAAAEKKPAAKRSCCRRRKAAS